MTIVLFVLVALLAYANGANDNSKGVATLVSFGSATPRQALFFAALTTALGAGMSFWFAAGMLKSFSVSLFESGALLPTQFYVAVLAGAFGWVILATQTGMPVSTTHAITGGLIGAGLVSFGTSGIQWSMLSKSFLLPLVLGPVLSLIIVYTVAWPIGWAVKRYEARCLCVTESVATVAMAPAAPAALSPLAIAPLATPSLNVVVSYESECVEQPGGIQVTTARTAQALHWFSGGMIGFSRGWNDAPKIAALSLIALPQSTGYGFVIVTLAMAAGGLLAGRKVLDTLSKKLTPLPLPESLTASLATAILVCLASWRQLPVSTTHVSTGAIVGGGLKNDPRQVHWKKVGEIGLSWLVTLPAAAVLAAGSLYLMRVILP